MKWNERNSTNKNEKSKSEQTNNEEWRATKKWLTNFQEDLLESITKTKQSEQLEKCQRRWRLKVYTIHHRGLMRLIALKLYTQ